MSGRFLPQYAFRRWEKRAAACLLDLIGSLFFLPLKFIGRRSHHDSPRKILVIRLDSIGDVVMTKPAIEALRRKFPKAEIDLLIAPQAASLFQHEPELCRVIEFKPSRHILSKIRKNRYEVGIDFRGDLRNILLMTLAGIPCRLGYGRTGGGFLLTSCPPYDLKKHQVFLNMRLLTFFGIYGGPVLSSFRHEKDSINASLPGKPRIAIHMGAGYPSKRWPKENYLQLIDRIRNEGLGEIILIGTEEDRNEIPIVEGDVIDLRGKTDLADLAVLFETCDLFVGNDSGPAHIAAAQGIDVFVIFSGTNDAARWHPWTNRLHLERHVVPCSPCESRECPLGHHDCMKKIPVGRVLSRVKGILSSRKKMVSSL